MTTLFPEDSAERKTFPVYSGLLQYFPSALAAVANHSHKGNAKHNPDQPLHHDRAKSGDEADALVRHLMEGDLVGMAWRALAMLQKKLEADGAPIAPGARNAPKTQWEDLRDYGVSITEHTFEDGALKVKRVDPADVFPTPPKAPAPKDHRRVATPRELAAYAANTQPGRVYPADRKATVMLLGDIVRIIDPSHDDVLCGFGKGSTAKVASRSDINMMVLLQKGHDTRWFHSKQLEVVPA